MAHVQAETIYTGIDVIKDAVLSFENTKIRSLDGSARKDPIIRCHTITPALIDPHAHIGMIRSGEPQGEAEANDQMDAVLATADALDSVQMDDTAFSRSIESGVLYSCVVPGSGNIIGGNSAVIRNYGATTTRALISRAGIKAALGYNPMSTRSWKGTRPFTRMGALSILRSKLHDTAEKMAKKQDDDQPKDAEYLVLRSILNGRERMRVHVHKIDDIAALLRLVDEFHIKVTVEHACDVHDSGIFRELASRAIPVVYGPMDALPYKVELKHENWRNIRELIDSEVFFGLMTDHPVILQQTLLLCLRWFLRSGLSKQDALEIVTRKNARILGVDSQLGTLRPGAWASFVCWNGDPFDLASYPVAVYGEGSLLHQE